MARSRIKLLGGLVIAGLLVAACGSDDDSSNDEAAPTTTAGDTSETTAAAEASGDPIRIGAVLSVTGPASTLGDQEAKALELRAEQINEAGGVEGRPIELRIEDDESNPDRAVEVTRSMISDFEPNAIVGGSVTATCYAMKPVTEEAEIVQYCLSGAPVPPDHAFYFSAMSQQPRWLGDLPLQWMKEQGYESVACLATDDASGQQYIKTVEGATAGAGLENGGTEIYGVQDVDVTAQLTSIRGNDPDIVYSCTSGRPVVPALQGAQQVGLDVPFWLGSGSASLDVAGLIKDLLPSAGVFTGGEKIQVYEQLPDDDPQKEAITEFAMAYEEAYGKRPDLFAAAAVDALDILSQSIAALGGDPAGADLVTYMEDEVEYTGLQLIYDFDAENHRSQFISGIVLQFTAEGGFELVEQYDDADIPTFCADSGQCP